MSIASERWALLNEEPLDEDMAAMLAGRPIGELQLAVQSGRLRCMPLAPGLREYDPLDIARYVMGGAPSELEALQKLRALEASMPRAWTARPTPVAQVGHVYLIETIEGPHRAKIGFTSDPDDRFANFMTSCPVEVRPRFVIPGTRQDERILHIRFKERRVRGEWFDGSIISEAERLMWELAHHG